MSESERRYTSSDDDYEESAKPAWEYHRSHSDKDSRDVVQDEDEDEYWREKAEKMVNDEEEELSND